MKISVFSVPGIPLGKSNVKDERLDQVDRITKAKKKTYLGVELVAEDAYLDSDAILSLKDSRQDLILKDLEFVEARLSKELQEEEKSLLNKLKCILEKEELVFDAKLSDEEKKAISGYSAPPDFRLYGTGNNAIFLSG